MILHGWTELRRETLYVLGAGGLGREIAATSLLLGAAPTFLDDNAAVLGESRCSTVVRGNIESAPSVIGYAIAGVGLPAMKQRLIARAAQRGFRFASFAHSRIAVIDARLGVGCFVAAGAVITVDIEIGDHVHVLNNATIGHDTVIGAYSTICPNSAVSGYCKIGRSVFIGAGAIILPRIMIGDNAIVGAGAVVTRDVPPDTIVVGIPARTKT